MKFLRVLVALIALAFLLHSPETARADGTAPAKEAPAAKEAAPAKAAEACAPTEEETRAEVPALFDFHDVIRTIWHDAWPNKDTKALRALLPDVEKGAKAVAGAELPGILRDRSKAWSAGVKELTALVDEYAAAAGGTDDQKLLDAAERLHSQYEKLVRVIRPALRELDAFHVVLYRLYHYDMKSDSLEAMRRTVGQLHEPMAALDAASLPARMKSLEKAFVAARAELSEAVKKLATLAPAGDLARVRTAIEEVHDRYQALNAVFD